MEVSDGPVSSGTLVFAAQLLAEDVSDDASIYSRTGCTLPVE